jgi:hypothetical protein
MPKRKCKYCKNFISDFIKLPGGVFCNVDHAIKFTQEAAEKKRQAIKKKQIKEFNKETRRLKNEIKSRAQWLKEAQKNFNKFIRERDKAYPCISCGKYHTGQYHGGHYKSVGGNPSVLRFNEDNCHKQCSICNNHLSGNIGDYRVNLIKKIGLDAVEKLEGPQELKKYTIEEIKEIKEIYRDKYKALIKKEG